MKILAGFLSLCLLLPSPAGACPELSRRTLRSGVEGTVQAGVEEKLKGEKLVTYPDLLRRRLEEQEFTLPGAAIGAAKFIRVPRKGILLPWKYPGIWNGLLMVNPKTAGRYMFLSMPDSWRPPQVLLLIEKLKEGQTTVSLGGDSAAGDRYMFDGILVKVIPKLGVLIRPYKTQDPTYIQRVETATPMMVTPAEDALVRVLGGLIVAQEHQRVHMEDFFKDQWLLREPDKSIVLYSDPRGFKILRSRLDETRSAGVPPYTLTAAFPEGTWSLSALQRVVPEIRPWQMRGGLPAYSNPIQVAGEFEPFRVMINDFGHTESLDLQLRSNSEEQMQKKVDPLIALVAQVMIPVPGPLDSLLTYLDQPYLAEGEKGLTPQLGAILSLERRSYATPAEREQAWKRLASFLTDPDRKIGSEHERPAMIHAMQTLVNLSQDPKRIRLTIPILEVLADPDRGEEDLVQRAGLWGKAVLNGRLAPRWFETDALSFYYGPDIQEQVGRLAQEAGADVAMLLPLNSRQEEVFRIQPYFYGGETVREQTRQYFDGVNPQLAAYGMEFASLQSPPALNDFERMGLMIYEKDLPKGTAPDGYRALPADRLDPSNPDRYEPVLVAASAIYPLLSLEFLRVRVKLVVVVQDSVTGARYLAVLA